MKATKFVAVLAVAGLALAACGDDDDDDDGGATRRRPAHRHHGGRRHRDHGGGRHRDHGSGRHRDTGSSGRLSRQGAARDGDASASSPTSARWTTSRSTSRRGKAPRRPPRRPAARADFIETAAATDYATNIGQFVDSGANVIITVGFALGEATAAAATENPDITFIGVDQFQAATVVQPDRPALPRGPGRLPRRRPRRPAHRDEHDRRRARHRPGPAGRRLQGGLRERGRVHQPRGQRDLDVPPGRPRRRLHRPRVGRHDGPPGARQRRRHRLRRRRPDRQRRAHRGGQGGGARCASASTPTSGRPSPRPIRASITSAMKLIDQGVVELVDGGPGRHHRRRQLLRRGRPGRLPRPGRPRAGRRADADRGDHRQASCPARSRPATRRKARTSRNTATGCGRLCRTSSSYPPFD